MLNSSNHNKSATKSDVPGEEQQQPDAPGTPETSLSICLPDCQLQDEKELAPTVVCGLCDRKHHVCCLGLPEVSTTIQGTYFCLRCLVSLRKHLEYDRQQKERVGRLESQQKELEGRLESQQKELEGRLESQQKELEGRLESQQKELEGRLESQQKERERRLESLEAQVATLEAEHTLLRERLDRAEASKGGELCDSVDDPQSPPVSTPETSLERKSDKRRAKFESLPENLMETGVSEDLCPSTTAAIEKVGRSHLVPGIGFRGVSTFRKRAYMSIRTTHRDHQADDNYLYCDDCNTSFLDSCPTHGQMKRIFDSIAPNDDPLRARNSLPTGLTITPSYLPGAGLGVRAEILIEKGTVFGPYEGRKLPFNSEEGRQSEYSWKITGQRSEPSALIDGSDPSVANWLRFVNCPIEYSLRNLSAFQYKGHIFYRCVKHIPAGTELLVWYGGVFQVKPQIPAAPIAVESAPHLEKQQTDAEILPDVEASDGVSANLNPSPGPSDNLIISSCSSISFGVADPIAPEEQSSDQVTISGSSQSVGRANPYYDQCRLCPIRVSKGSLGRHVRSAHPDGHSQHDLSYFQCPNCPLRFSQHGRFLSHFTRKHQEDEPFRGPSLTKRRRRSRSETDEDNSRDPTAGAADDDVPARPRRARCTQCPAVFASDALLREHRDTCVPRQDASEESWDLSPAPSPGSMARTIDRTASATASSLHDSAANFRCTRCPERFLLKGFLLEHIRKKHPDCVDEEICPHVCSDCGSRFQQLNHKNCHLMQCPARLSRLDQSNSQAAGDAVPDSIQENMDDADSADQLKTSDAAEREAPTLQPNSPDRKSEPEMIVLD